MITLKKNINMNQEISKWGTIGTVIWFLIISIFAFLKSYELPNSLNELGDALAGIFAPVAFLWLVLGYVQQGKQLDQNTKALEQQERALQLQIEEMRQVTQQQKIMTDLHARQLEMQIDSISPLIDIKDFKNLYPSTSGFFAFEVSWINRGETIFDVEIYIDYIEEGILAVKRWDKDQILDGENFSEHELTELINYCDFETEKYFPIRFSYKNHYGQRVEEYYSLDMYFSNQEILDVIKLSRVT